MFSNAKRRLLNFIQFQFDLRVGISDKGTWQFDLSITNDLIAGNDNNESVNAIGFRLEDKEGDNNAIES